jgi:hypothetical protein
MSHTLPVLVEINSSGAELGDLGHESWSLEIKATDTEKQELFKQNFNGPQLSSFFQQLKHVTRLTSADRYFGRSTPRACYQASIRPLQNTSVSSWMLWPFGKTLLRFRTLFTCKIRSWRFSQNTHCRRMMTA